MDTFWPVGVVGGIATLSYSFGASGDLKAIGLSLIGTVGLVIYEMTRKFKRDPIADWKDWLERNFVRLIFAAIIAPNAFATIVQIVSSLVK